MIALAAVRGQRVGVDHLQATRSEVGRSNGPEALRTSPVSERERRAIDHHETESLTRTSQRRCSGHRSLNGFGLDTLVTEKA